MGPRRIPAIDRWPDMPDLPWIDAGILDALVTVPDAIARVDAVMRDVSAGGSIAPQRWAMPIDDGGRMGMMPGALPGIGRFGIKVLGLFEARRRGELSSHQGIMLLFDAANGRPLCAVDAAALTALRTAAATAVATRSLARRESSTLTVLGCGEQAMPHIAALRTVLPIERVILWNRTRGRAERLSRSIRGVDVTVANVPARAVHGADVICTMTSATRPLLSGADVRPGQHLNLVGSSTLDTCEVDKTLVARSRYFVDSREHALRQAAELVEAIEAGLVDRSHIVAEVGEVLDGAPGRRDAREITIYKSLGHIAQDLAVADLAYERLTADPATAAPPATIAVPVT